MQQFPDSLLHTLETHIPHFQEADFLEAHRQAPSLSIRLNPLKNPGKEIFEDMQPVPWCPWGYYLPERPSFIFDPLLHAGTYYVQEASSMFVWQVLRQYSRSNRPVTLDLCAAPGGKTGLLASFFPEGLIVSNEVIKSRTAALTENISKWGSGNIVVTNNDPRQFSGLTDFFDLLLVDAPCSGSGLFRKDPQWMGEWTEQNVSLCSQRQQRILADAYPSLKEDGLLIYSTCSYSPEEDEAIADWLMENYTLESLPLQTDPSWHIEERQSPGKKAWTYRFFPHKLRGEGFFLAAFRKKESSGYPPSTHLSTEKISRSAMETITPWLNPVKEDLIFTQQGQEILGIPSQWASELAILRQHLYLKKAGTAIGTIKGKDLVPAPELAFSGSLPCPPQRVELEKEEALRYLRKQEITVKDSMQKGWALATYKGFGLGWLKIMPGRTNNYYPKEWRILKTDGNN